MAIILRESRLKLWGISLAGFNPMVQILILGLTMLLCQILHGVFTEYVARGILSGLMWSASAVELSTYAILSAIELVVVRGTVRLTTIPWKDYLAVAICISLGRGFTWVGYGTLNYPTVILFKSSKILFVMITGLIILKKRYATLEYIAAILAMSGLYLFSRADVESSKESTSDSLIGIGIICLAVICEATVSTLQERALKREQRSLAEMFFVTNGLGSILLCIIAGIQGELHLLGSRLYGDPKILLWLLATVVLAYGGTYAFTACIKGFGAVVATGMGIGRKFLSVLASYVIFPKPVLVQHQVGVVVFFGGLFISWASSWSSPPPATSPALRSKDSPAVTGREMWEEVPDEDEEEEEWYSDGEVVRSRRESLWEEAEIDRLDFIERTGRWELGVEHGGQSPRNQEGVFRRGSAMSVLHQLLGQDLGVEAGERGLEFGMEEGKVSPREGAALGTAPVYISGNVSSGSAAGTDVMHRTSPKFRQLQEWNVLNPPPFGPR